VFGPVFSGAGNVPAFTQRQIVEGLTPSTAETTLTRTSAASGSSSKLRTPAGRPGLSFGMVSTYACGAATCYAMQ
jgi:hypothetical protein